MKKITYHIICFILLIGMSGCSGYKPIFSSADFKFKIADYSIEGDKKLGNKIYSKLFNLSKSSSSQESSKNIYLAIKVLKEKSPTSKDSTGKVLEYKINLNTKITVKDYVTNNSILDQNFLASTSYKVNEQFSETIRLENKSIEDLLNQTYQELLIKLSESISSK